MDKSIKETQIDVRCNCTDCNGPRQVGPCLLDKRDEQQPTIRKRKKSNN